jgi:hypothetical protein
MKNSFCIYIALLLLTGCASAAPEPLSQPDSNNTANNTIDTFTDTAPNSGMVSTISGQVWADNWFSLHANSQLVAEDSVSITTERSFNAEQFTFEAQLPVQLAFLVKDYKENDTGLEYIGERNQQMGDGGFIAQFSVDNTVIGVTNKEVVCEVLHHAPVNKACESSNNPQEGVGDCASEITVEPADWMAANFDDSAWSNSIEYSAQQVSPKDGYNTIDWDPSAKLIWGPDLEQDNTLICRMTLGAIEEAPVVSEHFSSEVQKYFTMFNGVEAREEGDYIRIASNGLPTHSMMNGITNWQQQVPVPQAYTGNNSWSIPMYPEQSDELLLLTEHFQKGAVALAVNGVPIFNARNNRGEYAVEIGELDKWGGHSGRADDYHYHVIPEHLEDIVGKGNPVAYALDGYPVYSQTDQPLDEYLGRENEEGLYQYHATDYRPYFIAGFRGKVQVDNFANAPEDQVVPQSRSKPVRTGNYTPLRGAEIIGFTAINDTTYLLEYSVDDERHSIKYSWDENGVYTFEYTNTDGVTTTEVF